MRRKAVPAPPPDTLTARIETVAQTYYIAEGHTGRDVEDEAILSVVGTIECIGPGYQRFLGQPLEMALICARSFDRRELTPTANKPLLLPLQLGKRQRSLMVYLPSDAFWGLSRMIPAGLVTHVEASFSGLRYGTADLLSVHFTRKPQG